MNCWFEISNNARVESQFWQKILSDVLLIMVVSIGRKAADRISESKFNIFQTSITSVFWYRLSVAMISLSNCERPKRFYTRLRHLSKVRINFLVLCRVTCAEFARIWVSYNVIHLLYLWTNDGSININTSNKQNM